MSESFPENDENDFIAQWTRKEFKDENIVQLIAKSKYFEISRSLKPKQSSIV